MEVNFAKKQVTKISRNKIILMLVIVIGIALLIFVFAPSPANLYFKASTFKTAEEAEKLLAKGKDFVSVTAEELFDTGYEYTEDGKTMAKYYAFWAGEKCIVCKVDKSLSLEEYENYQLSGKLKEATGIEAKVINALKNDLSEYMDPNFIASYVIDTKESRLGTQIVVGIGILLIIIATVNIILAIISLTDYKKNKSFKKMGVDIEAAERLNQTISNLYNRGMEPKKIRNIHMIGDWLINYNFMGFTVCKKEDIVWIYKSVTRHRTNGIPTGKSYAIALRGKNKETFSVSANSDKNADQLMQELFEEFPYAIMGYSDELSELYAKNREGFLALQERSRQEREEKVEAD